MSWLLVVRWQARDAGRSKALWASTVLFGLAGATAVFLPAAVAGESLPAEQALVFLSAPLRIVVSLGALFAGYGAIAGPREAGQLKLIPGLPVDRTDLVVGTFVGRAAAVLVGVVVALAVSALALTAVYDGLPWRRLAVFGALLALLAISMTALAIGLSAAAATRSRAAAGAVGAFVLFEFFWGVVPAGAHYLATGSLPGATVPAWVVLLERLQPIGAFEAATDLLSAGVQEGIQLSPGGARPASASPAAGLADRLAGPPPFYLDFWAAVGTLIAWTLGPLAAGWDRFRRADL